MKAGDYVFQMRRHEHPTQATANGRVERVTKTLAYVRITDVKTVSKINETGSYEGCLVAIKRSSRFQLGGGIIGANPWFVSTGAAESRFNAACALADQQGCLVCKGTGKQRHVQNTGLGRIATEATCGTCRGKGK